MEPCTAQCSSSFRSSPAVNFRLEEAASRGGFLTGCQLGESVRGGIKDHEAAAIEDDGIFGGGGL